MTLTRHICVDINQMRPSTSRPGYASVPGSEADVYECEQCSFYFCGHIEGDDFVPDPELMPLSVVLEFRRSREEQ